VRNALDHGIETPDERRGCGKSPTATLTLSTRLEGEELVIAFADDGRGVDWNEIKELARRRGLPHVAQADLEDALFSDGLSTKGTVSEYSGRGVGMAAVAAATRDLDGRVHVHSEPGGGTRVELRFPRASLGSTVRASVRRSSGRVPTDVSAHAPMRAAT
jgi:chemotaxis protein histidine kinase CheA